MRLIVENGSSVSWTFQQCWRCQACELRIIWEYHNIMAIYLGRFTPDNACTSADSVTVLGTCSQADIHRLQHEWNSKIFLYFHFEKNWVHFRATSNSDVCEELRLHALQALGHGKDNCRICLYVHAYRLRFERANNVLCYCVGSLHKCTSVREPCTLLRHIYIHFELHNGTQILKYVTAGDESS